MVIKFWYSYDMEVKHKVPKPVEVEKGMKKTQASQKSKQANKKTPND